MEFLLLGPLEVRRSGDIVLVGGQRQRRLRAVIGLAGRFPGAPSVDVCWRELCAGRVSVGRFTHASDEG